MSTFMLGCTLSLEVGRYGFRGAVRICDSAAITYCKPVVYWQSIGESSEQLTSTFRAGRPAVAMPHLKARSLKRTTPPGGVLRVKQEPFGRHSGPREFRGVHNTYNCHADDGK